jgi:hypothetical protein
MEPSPLVEPREPQPKRRSPWLAGLGSVFFPPLGHVYAGRAGRGVLLYAGVTAIELSSIWVAAQSIRMSSLILMLTLVMAGVIWRIADAAMVARWRRRDAHCGGISAGMFIWRPSRSPIISLPGQFSCFGLTWPRRTICRPAR